MQEFIRVRVVSVKELFSGEFQFSLPWFQRAYAWLPSAVERLLNDILEAMQQPPEKRHYFLGNIMLAKEPDHPQTALVDGHQRVMTLTILFAVLRDLEADPEHRARLEKMISGPTYRLVPQESLRDFLERHVQLPNATERDPDEDLVLLSETERNIIENRERLKKELTSDGITGDTLRQLAEFLTERCFITASIVPDEDEAWRFLQIEERTRHSFNPTNRAKASLLAIVPKDERERCRESWERAEHAVGSDDMYALLGHIRALKTRKRSEKPAETELALIARLNRDGLYFFERELEPAANLLADIRRRTAGRADQRKEINTTLEYATWIAPQVWLPLALRWLEVRGEDKETALFCSQVERLIWMLRLAGHDATKQQRFVFRILSDIDKGLLVAEMADLEISKQVKKDALASLRAHTFDARRYATRTLRRASAAMGQDPGPRNPKTCTVEHILPSGWLAKSGWRKDFKTPKMVKANAHKLGNLTFLSEKHNRAAASKDWDEKRAVYAQSDFILTKELANIQDWNEKAIDERTERLIGVLLKSWDLPA